MLDKISVYRAWMQLTRFYGIYSNKGKLLYQKNTYK